MICNFTILSMVGFRTYNISIPHSCEDNKFLHHCPWTFSFPLPRLSIYITMLSANRVSFVFYLNSLYLLLLGVKKKECLMTSTAVKQGIRGNLLNFNKNVEIWRG